MNHQENEEMDYKKAYEEEHKKCTDLFRRIADLEAENEDLTYKLDRIYNNKMFKLTKPFRKFAHFVLRQLRRLRNCGNLKDVIAKIKKKNRERKIKLRYGTRSFPSAEEAQRQKDTVFDRNVKVSILVPLYNTPKTFLKEMIDSVVNQTYQNWELCLADGSDKEHEYVGKICQEYIGRPGGERIVYKKLLKNEGISGNTNACYKMATGEFIGLFDHDDILHPCALYEYVKVINEKDADYIYCDEITFKNGNINKMLTMHFKPDYAVDNLRANNYICHFSVFARDLLEGTELFRTKFDGSQDHDMILRLTDNAKNVVHVPKALYYWRSHAGSVASGIEAKTYAINAAKGAIAEHLRSHGFENFEITSTKAFETIFRVSYEVIGTPKVSIVIANKDHVEDLDRCISSILERTSYMNYEIIIVENNSETKEIFEYYDSLKERKNIKVVTFKGEFNYSAVNNLGVKHATGDYILLLNNDTQVISVNWIEELLMFAQREDVGAVGAKLYYPDKTIQHAGVVLQMGAHRTAGHVHCRQGRESIGYMGKLCYAQNVSAVTAACLLVSRAKYDEVGGLDENFRVALNDVDFCLKLREKGYLNIFTPYSELYHYESISRGSDLEGPNMARLDKEAEDFKAKWKEILDKGDPYYNPNFSLDANDYSLKMSYNE